MTEYEAFRKRFVQKKNDLQRWEADVISVAEQIQESLIKLLGAPDHAVTFERTSEPKFESVLPNVNGVTQAFVITVSFGTDEYKATSEFTVEHRGGEKAFLMCENTFNSVNLPVRDSDSGITITAATIWRAMSSRAESQF